MKNLFPNNFNWAVFIGVAFIIRVTFIDMSWFSFFSLLLALQQFILLFDSVGKIIPIRFLLGSFMCLQFFVGPTLAYNGFDKYIYYVYRMKISEDEYFSYAIPAVLAFIIGLHINSGNLKGEKIDQKSIVDFVDRNETLPYWFIAIGFLSSIISSFFSSEIKFVFFLLGSFKYIGLFLIVLGGKELKPLPLILVIGSIVSSSLSEGMFHDLLTWIIFTAAIYGIKYKFGFNIKLIGTIGFVLLAIVIQQLKFAYRDALKEGGQNGSVETFTDVYASKEESGGIFDFSGMAEGVTRINQGFIITNIMYTVPSKIPFENGDEMMRILESAVMPRILSPNKLNAGDREIFTKYSGIRLHEGTSMGLSSLGDAYINFGIFGGCAFMFVLGFVYSEVLKSFEKNSLNYPILIIFTPLVFYYPIRPDCELQTILGHLVKSCFLIFIMITFWKHTFYKKRKFSERIS